jgi:hypothetical protein
LGLFWYTVSFYSRLVSFIFARIICMNYKEKSKVVRVRFTLQFILSYREVRLKFECSRQKLSSFNLRRNVSQYYVSYMKLVYFVKRIICLPFYQRTSLSWGDENVPKSIYFVYIFRVKRESFIGERQFWRSIFWRIDWSQKGMTCLWASALYG